MDKSIVIDSFQGGLANTKTLGQKGSFYDSKAIDYRRNPEYVTLNRKVNTGFSVAQKPNAITLTSNLTGSISDLVNLWCGTAQGYLYDSRGEVYNDTVNPYLNVAYVNGTYYILGLTRVHTFTTFPYSEFITTANGFTGFTGTNWSASAGSAIHTTGATNSLVQSSPTAAVIGKTYHILVTNTSSAGTCTVSIGGATSSNLASGVNNIYLVATTTAGISFNPTSTYNGTISALRVDQIDITFNYKTLTVGTSTSPLVKRPFIDFYGDLIFGAGTGVSRINKDGTLIEYSSTQEGPVIGGLDGNVYAITHVGTNVYVWCNSGTNTNIYIWDGAFNKPTQKITIADRPVINTALLSNQHYWWSQKGVTAQKFVHIGENLQNQVIVKSDVPRDPTNSSNYPEDRLALYGEQTNAIETFGDYIFLPGYGKVFSFGSYYPGLKPSLNKEFTFTGSEVTAMLTTSGTVNLIDTNPYLLLTYNNGGTYYLGIVDFREWGGEYADSGYLETMEFSDLNIGIEKNIKKFLVPIMLGNANCSIKVYTNIDQAGYTLRKTLTTTDYGTGFNVAELDITDKWHTLQVKFELITTNDAYSPRLYTGTNILYSTTAIK